MQITKKNRIQWGSLMTLRERPELTKKDKIYACLGLCILALLIYGMISGTAPSVSSIIAAPSRKTSWIWVGLKYILIGLLTAGLCYPLVKASTRKHLLYFTKIRPYMIFQNIGIIVVVIACGFLLKVCFPFLDRSWLYRFPVTDGQAMNISLLPMFVKYLGLLYSILLVLNLPALAYSEEMSYRKGTRNWKYAYIRSLRFGLSHCLVGVPIYIGLALSVGGLWFTYQYFKGGIERSTVHHLTYNLIIVILLTALLLLTHKIV